MKDTSNLKIANRDAYINFLTNVAENCYTVAFEKGQIPGYEGMVNIHATCMETGEEMRIIWVEETEEVKQAKIN